MSFGSKMKELRKQAGLSQQEVADKLGMARATYASLEIDRREPDLTELRAIAALYEVPLIELVAEEGYDWPGVFEPTPEYKRTEKPSNSSVAEQAKLREVLLYVLDKIGAKPNVGESTIHRLLYLIDFTSHAKYGQSITGLSYTSNQYGPTPTIAFTETVKQMEADKELEIVSTKHFNNTQKKYLPLVLAELHELSARELLHIDQELARLSHKTATELSALAHV